MDKEGLRRAWGGPPKGEIANHIVPDAMFNDALEDYDPYPSDGRRGRRGCGEGRDEAVEVRHGPGRHLRRARVQERPACHAQHRRLEEHGADHRAVARRRSASRSRRASSRTPTRSSRPSKREVPISSTPGWGKDYADASTFMVLFDSRSILPEGNMNYSLVGLTPEQAKESASRAPSTGIPNVDADIDACNAIIDGDERNTCWEDLDKKLMEEVVPWVPYLIAQRRLRHQRQRSRSTSSTSSPASRPGRTSRSTRRSSKEANRTGGPPSWRPSNLSTIQREGKRRRRNDGTLRRHGGFSGRFSSS